MAPVETFSFFVLSIYGTTTLELLIAWGYGSRFGWRRDENFIDLKLPALSAAKILWRVKHMFSAQC